MVGLRARPAPPPPTPERLLGVLIGAVLAAAVAALWWVPSPPPAASGPRTEAGVSAAPGEKAANTAVPVPRHLAARLLTPADFGGYYRPDQATARSDLRASPCLTAVTSPGRPAAHAATYLAVGNAGGVPAILEVVDAYATTDTAEAAFRSSRRSLGRCRPFRADLAGDGPITPTLRPVPATVLGLTALGRSVTVVRGRLHAAGFDESLELAVVATRAELLVVVEVDRVPPVPGSSIYDDFGSAVVTAYGKLA